MMLNGLADSKKVKLSVRAHPPHTQYDILQDKRAFNRVVHWRELGEVENECTSYNFRQFAIILQKIVRFGGSNELLFIQTYNSAK